MLIDHAFIRKIVVGTAGLLCVSFVNAGTPLWTFSAPNPSVVTVSENGTAKIRYTVTNNSRRPKTLVMKPVTGLSASSCHLEGQGSSCNLVITINGSALSDSGFQETPVFCVANPQGKPLPSQCYQPKVEYKINAIKNSTLATSLQTSISDLALSIKGFTEYGVTGTPASGVSRVITITNTGNFEAKNFYVTPPAWPSGTYSTTTCGDTLSPTSSCTITITPGYISTSDGTNPCSNGTAPIPDVLEVTSANANSVSTNVSILSYGCIYQGGHVYAFDDSKPSSGSVGGKVATTMDQTPPYQNDPNGGVVWSSNGNTGNGVPGPGAYGNGRADASYDIIPGIDTDSTSASPQATFAQFSSGFTARYTNVNPFIAGSFNGCDGLWDGPCNTQNILTFYDRFITNYDWVNPGNAPFTATDGQTPRDYYAAGLCTSTISGYSDWYLPALCEMGYGSNGIYHNCGTLSTPVLQNMQYSLVDYNQLHLLDGLYWSSSQYHPNPANGMVHVFRANGSSAQWPDAKIYLLGVRCSRILTV